MPERLHARKRPKKRYNAGDIYSPLLSKKTKPEEVLTLVLKQIGVFLPPDVVKNKERRAEVIQQILTIRRYLRKQFREVLAEYINLAEIDETIAFPNAEIIPTVEDICALLPEGEEQDRLRERVGQVRDSVTADVLERLGFLPPELSIRPQLHGDTDHARSVERAFALLHELFPKWFLRGKTRLNARKRNELPRLQALQLWMQKVESDFADCVIDGFEEVSAFRAAVTPDDKLGQPYQISSDLSAKSLVELLEIIINPQLPDFRRIDALQVLDHAIGRYASRFNNLRSRQLKVLKELFEKLNITHWAKHMSVCEIPVARSNKNTHRPVFHIARAGEAAVEPSPRARNLKGKVIEILREFDDIVADTNSVFFHARLKKEESFENKVRLRRERYRECNAKALGYSVSGTSLRDAHHYLEERKRAMHEVQSPDIDLDDRPAAPEDIEDEVGISFGIQLKKPLDAFTHEERQRVDALFKRLADYYTNLFGLERTSEDENNLWVKHNRHNPKSNPKFRDYKAVASKKTRINVFGVRREAQQRETTVRVELQLMPAETDLLQYSPGSPASKTRYFARKVKRLIDSTVPHRVTGKKVYPPPRGVRQLEELEGALADEIIE